MAGLTSKMKRCAEILVAEPETSIGDIAQELEVDNSTIWRWRQREDYKAYEHELCHARFMDLEKLAIHKLQENARKGQQKAIEYLLDYIGYKSEQKVDVRSGDISINITGTHD